MVDHEWAIDIEVDFIEDIVKEEIEKIFFLGNILH